MSGQQQSETPMSLAYHRRTRRSLPVPAPQTNSISDSPNIVQTNYYPNLLQYIPLFFPRRPRSNLSHRHCLEVNSDNPEVKILPNLLQDLELSFPRRPRTGVKSSSHVEVEMPHSDNHHPPSLTNLLQALPLSFPRRPRSGHRVGNKKDDGPKPDDEESIFECEEENRCSREKVVDESQRKKKNRKAEGVNENEEELEGLSVIYVNGEKVDLAFLARAGDGAYEGELTSMTWGMSEAKLVGFIENFEGEWCGRSSQRRRVVEADEIVKVLPRNWKIELALRHRAGLPSIYCRSYVSSSGLQFKSCKDVARYLRDQETMNQTKNACLTVSESQVNKAAITSVPEADANLPPSYDLYDVEVGSKIDCSPCGVAFKDMQGLVKHLASFHKKTTRRLNLPTGEGRTLEKDGFVNDVDSLVKDVDAELVEQTPAMAARGEPRVKILGPQVKTRCIALPPTTHRPPKKQKIEAVSLSMPQPEVVLEPTTQAIPQAVQQPVPQAVQQVVPQAVPLADINAVYESNEAMDGQVCGVKVTRQFWGKLLAKTANAWLWTDHIEAWILLLLRDRPANARWAAVPPFFGAAMIGGAPPLSWADGTFPPYIAWWDVDRVLMPINILDQHWLASELDLNTFTMTLYDSYPRKDLKPFLLDILTKFGQHLPAFLRSIGYWGRYRVDPGKKIKLKWCYVKDVPKQVGNRGDCGVFTCMFLERLSKGESVACEGSGDEIGMAYRLYMADVLYRNRA